MITMTMDLCEEATEELQNWIDSWIEVHKSKLAAWMSKEAIDEFFSVVKEIKVYWGEFRASVPASLILKEMEIGSTKMPQFRFISSMNHHLDVLYPKYRKANEGYIFNQALERNHKSRERLI